MANITDGINKAISKGFNVYGQARALGSALGLFGGGKLDEWSLSNQVVSEIRKNGISKPSLAFTEIILPKILQPFWGNVRSRKGAEQGQYQSVSFLSFRNDAFSTPDLSLATTDIRRYGVGPTEKKPYGVVYQDVRFDYILDATQVQHKFFYEWMNNIVKHSYKNLHSTNSVSPNDMYPYEVNYKSEYATRILVHSFDETFDRARGAIARSAQTVTLHEAYPIYMGNIQYNWAGVDQLIRIPVTFTFYRWDVNQISSVSELSTTQGSGLGLFGTLIKAGTAIQALSTIRSPKNIQDVVNAVNTTSTVLRNF
jgi:hypothetical protein